MSVGTTQKDSNWMAEAEVTNQCYSFPVTSVFLVLWLIPQRNLSDEVPGGILKTFGRPGVLYLSEKAK